MLVRQPGGHRESLSKLCPFPPQAKSRELTLFRFFNAAFCQDGSNSGKQGGAKCKYYPHNENPSIYILRPFDRTKSS